METDSASEIARLQRQLEERERDLDRARAEAVRLSAECDRLRGDMADAEQREQDLAVRLRDLGEARDVQQRRALLEESAGRQMSNFQSARARDRSAKVSEAGDAALTEIAGRASSGDARRDAAVSHWQRIAVHLAAALPTGRVPALNAASRLRDVARALREEGLVDPEWYRVKNPDVAGLNLDPAEHFLRHGLREGRLPAPAVEPPQNEGPDVATLAEAARTALVSRAPVDMNDLISREEALTVQDLDYSGARAEARRLTDENPARVSVVIPTYNRAATILKAVRSALEQSVPPHEVIVADDASTDPTLALMREAFPSEIEEGRLVILECEKGGVCRMRNAALEVATGNVIAFLDSDNFWKPDHLLWALAAMEATGAQSVYTGANVHHLSEHWSRLDCKAYDRRQLLAQNFIDLNCLVHRTSLYRAHGGFDPDLTRLVDWDYVIRVTKAAAPVRVPVATVEYFLSKGALNNISFVASLEENARRIQIKHLDEMRAHGVLNPRALARLEAKTEVPATPEPARKAEALAPTVPAPAGAAVDAERMPYFGGLPLFVVLPEGIAPPVTLPVDRVAARYVRHGADGIWQEVDGAGTTLTTFDTLPDGNYWCPDLRQAMPSAHQVATLTAATELSEIDVAIGSLSLDRAPTVAATCLRNQIVMRVTEVEGFLAGRAFREGARGKLLRIPQGPAPETARLCEVSDLIGAPVTFRDGTSYFAVGETPPLPAVRSVAVPETIPAEPGRPRILVLAQKLAVGGVERNTVEVSRALAQDHDCLYLTLEPIAAEQGSLCHQALEACINVLDLAEIAHHGIYPDLLDRLAKVYAPDALWICNGSMWLSAHAEEVRGIFDRSGIVDQQVYDTEAGWIQHYGKPGIRSFDRFVAVNTKIRERFVTDFDRDPEHVDLIYSAINADRFRAARAAEVDRVAQRDHYGLPVNKTIIAFMGRLVDQKRPLDVLKIAELCSDRDDLHFVIVGNGTLAPQLEDALAQSAPANVSWIRNVPDTTTFWPAVDGYLVTSEYEGLPIALIEAIALGVPALSTDVGAIREVLDRFGAGRIVPDIGNPETFAATLRSFVEELPETRARLMPRGNEIIDFFSADTISRQFADSFAKAKARRTEEEDA
ncbi:glycosyltransferase [Roseivivax marinus]|uniref:glycosyltransferase n=1 Tax=Roseivivax marinus TaxID=1379903 RepID=UPI00273FA58D|nr:glycosyltransferase [Roseivivax marinus]